MSPAHDLKQLIEEARILAEYAARNGKLPEGSRVFQAIAQVAAFDTQPGDEQQAVEFMYRELNFLAQAIAPVTLRQVVRRRTLVGQVRYAFANIVPFGIGLLTLMLTCYLAFQSSQLHKADTALREYHEWVAEMPREKLYHAWKMFKYERVLNVQTPPLAQLDAYQKLVEDARRLAEKGEAIQALLTESSADVYVPPFLASVGPVWWQRFATALNSPPNSYDEFDEQKQHVLAGYSFGMPTKGELVFPPPAAGAPPSTGGSPLGAEKFEYKSLSDKYPKFQAPDCKKSRDTARVSLNKSAAASMSDVDAYTESIDCFLRSANIPTQFATYSPWSTIYPIKSKINLLVVCLLPSLYGLLGACVYLMRDFVLVSGTHVLARSPTVLSMLSLSLRIALGGLAGVIIGWFWVPSGTGPSGTTPAVSSIPFGMAFLAGFSIETLFSLLDRMNKAIDTKGPPSDNASPDRRPAHP